jgi:hypothetical protein
MKFKPAWIALGAAAVILIAVIVLIVATVNKPLEVGSEGSNTEQVKVEKTLSGKSVAEDKNDVLASAISLLSTVNAPKDATEFQAYMGKIDSGEVKVPAELTEKVRLVDTLATEDGIESTLFQTLVTFATFAKQSSGSDEITPLYDNAAQGIILDQEMGLAYVPTTLFVNSGTGVNGFSMEFVYVDGEWKLSPYMTLDELRLALVLQGSGTSPTK